MPEGLSPGEVSKEIAEHRERAAEAEAGSESEAPSGHDRRLSIAEALLLSLVAVLAAYSGYAAAKWGTESSVQLAKASAQRTRANRFDNDAIVTRTLDSVSFNAWFSAFSTGNKKAEALAVKRLRPGYRPAFNAWLATDPAHNPNAPPGPSYMPQYIIPEATASKVADAAADEAFAKGTDAGETADKYIRDTVFLATVLFLGGISGHFRVVQARLGLILLGAALLVFSVIQLLGLPGPP